MIRQRHTLGTIVECVSLKHITACAIQEENNSVNYENYPVRVIEDLIRLRSCIKESGLPSKVVDYNLLIGTWNNRNFSRTHPQWSENSGSPCDK